METQTPDPHGETGTGLDAEALLARSDELHHAGQSAGVYSQGVALTVAATAGLIAGLMVAGSAWWVALFVAGILALLTWQQRRPASAPEVTSRGGLTLALLWAAVLVGIVTFGFVAAAAGWPYAGPLTGVLVTALLYGLMAAAYQSYWDQHGGA